MSEASENIPGKRRPNADDVPQVLEWVSDGLSLREACQKQGVHPGGMSRLLDTTAELRAQYAHARAQRAEHQQEQMLTVGWAAATGQEIVVSGVKRKVDPHGARVLLDAMKWTAARMDPKTVPTQRVAHSFEGMARSEMVSALDGLLALPAPDDSEGGDDAA